MIRFIYLFIFISGNAKSLGDSEFSLELLHRQSVVAQTKITFPKKQLLQLIQEYLAGQGRESNYGISGFTRNFCQKKFDPVWHQVQNYSSGFESDFRNFSLIHIQQV